MQAQTRPRIRKAGSCQSQLAAGRSAVRRVRRGANAVAEPFSLRRQALHWLALASERPARSGWRQACSSQRESCTPRRRQVAWATYVLLIRCTGLQASSRLASSVCQNTQPPRPSKRRQPGCCALHVVRTRGVACYNLTLLQAACARRVLVACCMLHAGAASTWRVRGEYAACCESRCMFDVASALHYSVAVLHLACLCVRTTARSDARWS